ncbi:putative nodulin homeobox protein [Helianthus annuus]|nr:putative nodulin homeobox protein [Helianthus annuus]
MLISSNLHVTLDQSSPPSQQNRTNVDQQLQRLIHIFPFVCANLLFFIPTDYCLLMKIWKLGQNALAAAASKQQKLGFRQVDAEPIQLTGLHFSLSFDFWLPLILFIKKCFLFFVSSHSSHDVYLRNPNTPLEEAKPVNITGSEDPRTDVAPTITPRFFQETEGDTQNLETAVVVLDSNTVQSEEKQLRKRKCNIMNHMQVTMIEQALQNEPDMQRKAASI